MRLLIIKVLNAVFCAAQKVVSTRHGLGRIAGHQACLGQTLQCIKCWAGSQFRKLPAAHNLQQLHGKFDFANAST